MKRAPVYLSFILFIYLVIPLSLTGGGQKSTSLKPASDKITLRYVSSMWREDAIRIQENQIEEFENAHPSIEVEPTIYVPWTEYRTWLLRAIASDTLPDVVQHGVEFLDIKLLDNQDFDDGLHLNAIGHEKVFNQVRDFLIEKHWI